MAKKRYITRSYGYPEPARTAAKLIRLLEDCEVKPETEVFDEETLDWKPLKEVEPFASYLAKEEELRQLGAEAYAKKKHFRRPALYLLTGLGVLLIAVVVAMVVASLFNVMILGMGDLPDLPRARAELAWKFVVDAPLSSSPFYADGRLYFGSEDGYLYCVNAEDGHGLWKHDTGEPIIGEPLVADGKVYIGSCDNALWCFDTETGKRLWRYATGFYIGGGVFSDGDAVYFGSYDHRLYCLDAQTGAERWSFETADWIFSTPFVSETVVYFGSFDGRLYCLDKATGAERWSYDTNSQIKSSPYLWEGKLYFGADDTFLYCLDAETGERLWRWHEADYRNFIRSRMVVFDGRVYLGCYNQRIYCVDAVSGELIWKRDTTNTVEAGGCLVGTTPEGGEFVLGQSYTRPANLTEEPAYTELQFIIGSANGSLYNLDGVTGEPIWGFAAKAHILSDPAYADGRAFFASEDGKVYAIDTAPAE